MTLLRQEPCVTAPRPEILLSDDHKRILRALRGQDGRSRIALAAELNINSGVVTRLSKELLAFGLIHEAAPQSSGRGRPSLPLHLKGDGAYAIGAAIQPGWVDVAVVDLDGALVGQGRFDFPEGDPRQFAEALEAQVGQLTIRLRRSRFLGYGVSVPGFAVAGGSCRHTVERLKSWRDLDLSRALGGALGAPVWIENDANAVAMAEYYAMPALSDTGMLVLYMGYGVGAGCIANGRLFTGDFFNAGEIGVLYPLGKPRPSAIDLVETLAAQGLAATLADIDAEPERFAAQVEAWTRRAADQLKTAVLSGIAWFDPARIVIAGALPGPVLGAVSDQLARQDWAERLGPRPKPVFSASHLGGAAAAMGAAMLPIHAAISPAS